MARFGQIIPVLAAGILLALRCTAGTPTFSKDVWPIMQQRCVGCHQPGEIAPMSFTSYKEVRPWARAIRQAVLERKMPPWSAMPNDAIHFRNDRSLTQAQIDTLVRWAEAGAPEGDTLPSYVPVHRDGGGWKLGKPDHIITVPGFNIPATGQVPYSFLIVPTHFDHDVWVRAAEYRIDQRAMIHHINAFVRPPGSSFLQGFPAGQIFVPTLKQRAARREGENAFDRRELLLGYEPGYEPGPWLANGAKLIRAGSDIIFELHYTPNGKPAVDHSQFALYFSTAPPEQRVLAIDTLRDLDLQIPPGAPHYRSEATFTLGRPLRLLSVQPHMHLRGSAMQVTARCPDGRSISLVDVPHYDFNWQTTYVFEKPLDLPADTQIVSVAYFDNSPNNKFNPDPSATVQWGDQTTEEMHIAFLELAIESSADPARILKQPPRMLSAGAGTR